MSFFQETLPPGRGGRYSPLSFPCGMPQAEAGHQWPCRPQTRGQKSGYMRSRPVLPFVSSAPSFSALLSVYARSPGDMCEGLHVKRSAGSADPHPRMTLLFVFQGPPQCLTHRKFCQFQTLIFVFPHKMFVSHHAFLLIFYFTVR